MQASASDFTVELKFDACSASRDNAPRLDASQAPLDRSWDYIWKLSAAEGKPGRVGTEYGVKIGDPFGADA